MPGRAPVSPQNATGTLEHPYIFAGWLSHPLGILFVVFFFGYFPMELHITH